MGLLFPYLVAYIFSEDGSLFGREVRDCEYLPPNIQNNFNIYDKVFQENLENQFEAWKNQIGFQPETVKVKVFFDEDFQVGIEEIPEHLKETHEGGSPFKRWLNIVGEISEEEVLDGDWPEETQEEREDREEGLKEWLENGNFVFWWAKDYYMSKDGKVEST